MRWVLVLAAVGVAGASMAAGRTATPPPVQPAAARSDVITDPIWVRQAGPGELDRFYPKGAHSTGGASISCAVTAEGRLINCVVLSEYPSGKGFGDALVKATQLFQLAPKARDGRPVAGRFFVVSSHFDYRGATPPHWIRPPSEAEFQEVWPEQARGLAGEVELKCFVTDKGDAKTCTVQRESPPGKGFGAAALKLQPKLALAAGTFDGHPTNSYAELIIPFPLPKPRQTGVANFGDGRLALQNAPWAATPSPADMAAAWPKQAPADLAQGKAWLRCGFSPQGALVSCSAVNEDPAGEGLGAAALSLAGRFRLLDGAADPQALPDTKVTLPFTFTNPKRGGQSPAQITKYSWVKFIDLDRMSALYPGVAADAGIRTGRGDVDCVVGADGGMTGCVVVGEDPPGKGFGQAAMMAAGQFVTNPWTDDGRPAAGARIHLPIRFNEAEPGPQPAPAGPPAAAPSAAAKAP